MLLTAVLAVVATPISWLGPWYVASAGTTLAMLALFALALRRESVGLAVLAFFVGVLPFGGWFAGAFFLPIAFLSTFAAVLAVVVTSVYPLGWRRRFLAVCGVVAIVYAFGFFQSYQHSLRIERALAAHPVVDLSDRLVSLGLPVAPVVLATEQDKQLSYRDNELRRSWRVQMLKRLHSRNARRFAAAVGFGVARMPMVPIEGYEAERVDEGPWPQGFVAASSASDLLEVHRSNELSFLAENRWGYVPRREHAAGFAGHAFKHDPLYWHQRRHAEDEDSEPAWQLNRLELIGLMRHAEPVAYVAEGYPDMNELVDASTRPLDEFERGALEALWGDSDLEVREGLATPAGTPVRMVGSLRAGKGCADCHQAPRGTLLGAFSYRLTRLASTTADGAAADGAAADAAPSLPPQSPPSAGG